MTFMDVNGSIGLPEDTPYDGLAWLDVDFTTSFGLKDLSGAQIAAFVDRLSAD